MQLLSIKKKKIDKKSIFLQSDGGTLYERYGKKG